MGTDIHYWAERRTNGLWEACSVAGKSADGGPRLLEFYCGEERNYCLFAILAGVERLTNHGFEPIVAPRGLPTDSPLVQPSPGRRRKRNDEYGHNATWLLLRELLEFPWHEKKRLCTGYVDAEQYFNFKLDGRPDQYLLKGATCGPARETISNEEMERLIDGGRTTDGLWTLIFFEEQPYADYAGPFITETLQVLRALGETDDVRLIVYFDS